MSKRRFFCFAAGIRRDFLPLQFPKLNVVGIRADKFHSLKAIMTVKYDKYSRFSPVFAMLVVEMKR
jgi:hypothetical protein